MEAEKTILVELTEDQFNAVQYCVNVVNLEAMRDERSERRNAYRRPEYLKIINDLPGVVEKFHDLEGK